MRKSNYERDDKESEMNIDELIIKYPEILSFNPIGRFSGLIPIKITVKICDLR